MTKFMFKEISKLNKIPHPKSRKTAQLTRKAIRSAARQKQKNANLVKQNVLAEKLMWFKENLEQSDNLLPYEVLELIERYLRRFDNELEQINIKHSVGFRKGRQHANREDIIKMTRTREFNEFNTCGLEIPDLFNKQQLSALSKWNGELRFLPNFKIIRCNRSKLKSLIKENEETEMRTKDAAAGSEMEGQENEKAPGMEVE